MMCRLHSIENVETRGVKVVSTKARRYVGIEGSEELCGNINRWKNVRNKRDMPLHSNKSGQDSPASRHIGYAFPIPRN